MPNLSQFLPILDLILVIALVVGGAIAVRSGFASKSGEMQERAIVAQNAQIETQVRQIETYEKRIVRLEQTLARVRKEMAKRGVQLETNGETITFIESGGRRVSTVPIYLDEDKQEEKEA